MIQRLKKMKENKKGFTLVELIVVLVILAILIALLVPALTGYIDKARSKTASAEGRQVLMAAQTVAGEKYDAAATGAYAGDTYTLTAGVGAVGSASEEVAKLAEVKGNASITVGTDGKISTMTYTRKGWTATYTAANDPQWVTAETE